VSQEIREIQEVRRERTVSLGNPIFLPDMEEAAVDALRNDRYLFGENVVKFEEEFARFVGTKYAVATSSGTNALQFILLALDMRGKKVVTTPNSFIASANAIIQAGGTPVFADITEENYCLSPTEAEKQLRSGASGMLPVHIYGYPSDFDEFRELSVKYNVPIVEDACQAHGAAYKGRMAGSLGTAAAFSFYPRKNMSVLGDGGMVTTDDEKIAKMVAKLRDGGRVSRYEHDVVGYTSRLNSVNAAIGRVQLRHLDEWNRRRKGIAKAYGQLLKDVSGITLPPTGDEDRSPVYHQYVIRSPSRDLLKAHLERNGVESGVHYPIPIHMQPVYVKMYGYQKGAYPRSERLAAECLSLPMSPMLSDADVKYVSEVISRFDGRDM
jgi:perosamine synthetase